MADKKKAKKTTAKDNLNDYEKALEGNFCCSGSLSTTITIYTPKFSITFPTKDQKAIDDLKTLCNQATFGKGNKETLDTEYRNALVLNPDTFGTNFHPSEHDVLQQIQRLMSPECSGITAKLYKLNIYPEGGKFKAHVDTPRGEDMIGSLVISLPFPHEGGALAVRQLGKEQVFDFSKTDQVQWAAFFADCEHEIYTVTKGSRVVLTYNLYKTGRADLTPLVIDSPFYKLIQGQLQDKGFMPSGGTLAFACKHNYANDALLTVDKDAGLPLKGSDAVTYTVLKKLGLQVSVKAIYRVERYAGEMDEEEEEEDEEDEEGEDECQICGDMIAEYMCNGCNKKLCGMCSDNYKGSGHKASHKMEPLEEKPEKPEKQTKPAAKGGYYDKVVAIYIADIPKFFTEEYWAIDEETSRQQFIQEKCGAKLMKEKNLVWATEHGTELMAGIAPSYGNQPATTSIYFEAVILAKIPKPGQPPRP